MWGDKKFVIVLPLWRQRNQNKVYIFFFFLQFYNVIISGFFSSFSVFDQYKLVHLQLPQLREEKGNGRFVIHWDWKGWMSNSGPSSFHSQWKAWLEWRQTSLKRKDEVHFYNQDDNERPCRHSADTSSLPNEALDNHAHIKRPPWSYHTRFYLLLPPFKFGCTKCISRPGPEQRKENRKCEREQEGSISGTLHLCESLGF